VKKLICPPIEIVGGDDLVSQPGDVQHGEGYGRLSRGRGQGAGPSLEGGDPLLEDLRSRVRHPGIDIPELLKGKEARRMLRALKHV